MTHSVYKNKNAELFENKSAMLTIMNSLLMGALPPLIGVINELRAKYKHFILEF